MACWQWIEVVPERLSSRGDVRCWPQSGRARKQHGSDTTSLRIHLLAAREAPVVVILQRKRNKLFHVITLDTETDAINEGSWFRGMLYPPTREGCRGISCTVVAAGPAEHIAATRTLDLGSDEGRLLGRFPGSTHDSVRGRPALGTEASRVNRTRQRR